MGIAHLNPTIGISHYIVMMEYIVGIPHKMIIVVTGGPRWGPQELQLQFLDPQEVGNIPNIPQFKPKWAIYH